MIDSYSFFIWPKKKKMENGDWADEEESANADLFTLFLLLPSSTNVPVLLLNQPKVTTTSTA